MSLPIHSLHYECPHCGSMVLDTISPNLYQTAQEKGFLCPACHAPIPARAVMKMDCPFCHAPQTDFYVCEQCRDGFATWANDAWTLAGTVVKLTTQVVATRKQNENPTLTMVTDLLAAKTTAQLALLAKERELRNFLAAWERVNCRDTCLAYCRARNSKRIWKALATGIVRCKDVTTLPFNSTAPENPPGDPLPE